jgi:uncharacterized protein YjgD (DUF1641 family)
MAKYIEYKPVAPTREEVLGRKLDAAPLEHAEALLKAYELLETANKHGILDLLRGAISAENTILEKVSEYASTAEGINVVRNLMILGRLIGSIDPEVLSHASKDLIASVLQESKRRPKGFLTATQRLRRGDAQRGLSIALAALESIGKTARVISRRQGEEK